MKPTVENLKKEALESKDLKELETLRDHLVFYVAGLKTAAFHLGRSPGEIEKILDEARRAEEIINDRIREF